MLGKIEKARRRLILNLENCKRFNNLYGMALSYEALMDILSSLLNINQLFF